MTADHITVKRDVVRSIAYPGSVAGSTRKKDAALAALAALEQELDALADVAAAGNEREKRLEQELAEAKAALVQLRGAWNAHMATCSSDVPAVTWAQERLVVAEADNARLREAATKVTVALWKGDDLVNAIVALRAALAGKEGT